MKHQGKLQGFTLIELIVVIALFGMIIAVALGLLTPINHLNKYATVNADAQAIEDDLRRFLESKLQYADRFAVYTNVEMGNPDEAVDAFRYKYYFDDPRRPVPCSSYTGDTVYVLHVDNEDPAITNGLTVANNDRMGTVTLRRYNNGVYDNNQREWALNSDYYREYAFNIDMGSLVKNTSTNTYSIVPLQNVTVNSSTTFISPNNFTFTISMFKKERIAGNIGHKTLADTGIDKVVSFKLKNVVNGANAIKSEQLIFSDTSNHAALRFHWYDPSLANAENISTAGKHDDDSTSIAAPSVSAGGNDIYVVFSTALDIEQLLS